MFPLRPLNMEIDKNAKSDKMASRILSAVYGFKRPFCNELV